MVRCFCIPLYGVCPLTRALGARSCIDQRDIETNLRCLPIFLSGCQKLVILLGKTYLTRLWCIVEIFAFVHMGGKPSDIVILPVIDSSDETELATFLEASLSLEFDARLRLPRRAGEGQDPDHHRDGVRRL